MKTDQSSMQKMMMLQCDYEVIDFTDESNTTPLQQHDYFPYDKKDVQFPTHRFINIALEWLTTCQTI